MQHRYLFVNRNISLCLNIEPEEATVVVLRLVGPAMEVKSGMRVRFMPRSTSWGICKGKTQFEKKRTESRRAAVAVAGSGDWS